MTKFVPPSTWGVTAAQRIARLRRFIELTKGRRGRAEKQRARYLEEIVQIEEQQNAQKITR